MKLEGVLPGFAANVSGPAAVLPPGVYEHKSKALFEAVKLTLVKSDFPAFLKLWDCALAGHPDGEKAIRRFYDDAPKGGAAQLMKLGKLQNDQDPVTYYAAVENAPPKFVAAFRIDAMSDAKVVWFGVFSLPD